MEKSKVLRVLEFAAKKEEDGESFTAEGLMGVTKLSWKELWQYSFRVLAGQQWVDGIFSYDHGSPLTRDDQKAPRNGMKYKITYPAMMHWMEYQELKESRLSSRNAQTNATISIYLAVAAIAVAVWLGVFRPATVRLDDEQLSRITSALSDTEVQ